MYHESASPVTQLDYLAAGGGTTSARDKVINDAKLAAVRAAQIQHAKEEASKMLIELDTRKFVRNMEASEPVATKQVLTLLVIVGSAYLISKHVSR